eukprot:6212771-Pleurochrysis_carterae.AAC.2
MWPNSAVRRLDAFRARDITVSTLVQENTERSGAAKRWAKALSSGRQNPQLKESPQQQVTHLSSRLLYAADVHRSVRCASRAL